ncbi:hypothetical protein FEE59_16355 [Herbaspirillum sp. RU 5E]|nr:hypothetical protein [Herbaspirillum sp. RU 5E]
MAGVIPFLPAIPAKKVGDVVMVRGIGLMEWTDIVGTGEFHGYRSLRCGALEFGTTTAPRTYEADLVGGLGSKASQASIWAWAQQNGHAVAAAAWSTKVFKFADVDANTFRFPDLRDVFPRFLGTNLDSGSARLIGSYQVDDFKSHSHSAPFGNAQGSVQAGLQLVNSYAGTGGTNATGGTETRPANTAFAPRIHI